MTISTTGNKEQRVKKILAAALAATACASAFADAMEHVDSLIGTEGSGSQYGGIMPYVGVPFGSFQMVPMTRLNRVGRLSFNQADGRLGGELWHKNDDWQILQYLRRHVQ